MTQLYLRDTLHRNRVVMPDSSTPRSSLPFKIATKRLKMQKLPPEVIDRIAYFTYERTGDLFHTGLDFQGAAFGHVVAIMAA